MVTTVFRSSANGKLKDSFMMKILWVGIQHTFLVGCRIINVVQLCHDQRCKLLLCLTEIFNSSQYDHIYHPPNRMIKVVSAWVQRVYLKYSSLMLTQTVQSLSVCLASFNSSCSASTGIYLKVIGMLSSIIYGPVIRILLSTMWKIVSEKPHNRAKIGICLHIFS